jgi:membrane-associated phospholipid phosphatase
VLAFNKGEVEYFVNQHYTTYFNYFFSITTHYGDGMFAAIALLSIILFVSVRDGLSITAMSLLLSAVVQSMKHLWFGDLVRPKLFLKDLPLNFVPGIEIHSFNSFPSGHTAQAFLLSFIFCQLFKSNVYTLIFFMLALFTAMSRVYLLQHFVVDVYAGAIAALVCSIIYWKWIHNSYVVPKWNSKPLIKL